MIKIYYKDELVASQKGDMLIREAGVPIEKYPAALFGIKGLNEVEEVTMDDFYEWYQTFRALPKNRNKIKESLEAYGLKSNKAIEWISKTGGVSAHDHNRFEIKTNS